MDDTNTHPATIDSPEANPAETLVSLERLIITHLAQIEAQEAETRKKKEMLENIFGNNPQYQEVMEQAKAVAKEKAAIRRRLLQAPDARALNVEIKEAVSETKEKRDALSTYLAQYAQAAGTTQFEDDQGQVREIIYVARLVKRSEKFRT